MQESTLIAAADVAKAELVVSFTQSGDTQANGCSRMGKLPNTKKAIAGLLKDLPAASIVAMESSGRYHQLLAQMAYEAGMQVYVLNARDVAMYAKAISARGKTDRLDAGVIARFVREHRAHLRSWSPSDPIVLAMQTLMDRRVLLTQQQVRIRQSMEHVAELQPIKRGLMAAFALAFKEIDELLKTLMHEKAALEQGAKRLRSVTGIGAQTGTRLAVLFSRIDFANADAVVAYSGLDPRAHDSGTRHGRRRLSKRGPAELRWQLYMAALSASTSVLMRPLYTSLCKRFATTEAVNILARKLLRIAWGVWKSGKAFDPARFAGTSACQKA